MAAYAAFLRGINVGGHRVGKDRLVAVFEALGFESVSTFRASGNVLFEAGDRAPAAGPIADALEDELGYAVPVFMRSGREIGAIAAARPFSPVEQGNSEGKHQIAFLPRRPAKPAIRSALALERPGEPIAIEGAELHWLPRGRMSDSETDLKALESILGPWTMRTRGTVEQIAARLAG